MKPSERDRLRFARAVLSAMALLAISGSACSDDEGASSSSAPGDAGEGGTPGEGGATSSGGSGIEPRTLAPSEGVERSAPDADAPVTDLAVGFNGAGFELWRTQPVEENFVFSPLSIGHALLMARAAADEDTAESIDRALGLPEGLSAHQAWNAFDQSLTAAAEDEEELTITIADRIWPRLDVMPDQTWIDLLASEHGASVQPLDFTGDGDGSRDAINQWVGDQTDGRIPELLPEGFIKPETVLVLTDAIYYKARWQRVFGKYQSVTDEFAHLDGSTQPVELMHELELSDPRGEGDGFVGAEIPYVGGALSMLVLIPDAGRFEEIRDGLDQDFIDAVDATFTTGPYELFLPGWATTSTVDLLDWLTDLGAAPGLYPRITPDAFLGAAVHGADISVDEWGTVAAAATGLGFEESGPPEPEITIKADRPFLYLIRHRESGMVLFAGQVTEPGE